ncbi:hypothetical protein V5P93_000746 [Actinokineospora auranticolor]|uniref:Trehalose utilization protein n=1 Tax=Actinokineospora auranticolor TaxID=155976 RepID=A0A2S6GYR6_9PSEU|nr:hypothetical protein [Actinokineospora auranticolor]PPK70374.1 hypothetical protein CLV40_102287 [Actinokineospora auranticolor]
MSELANYVDEVGVNLVAVFIVFIARVFGFDVYTRLIRGGRAGRVRTRRLWRADTVLLYTDCDDELHTSNALAKRLQAEMTEAGTRTKVSVVRDGGDLARWPFSRPIAGIVLLITDVTQLSSRPRERERLQKRLAHYVRGGGCLVLGHDVIWRRSRNERLQKLAGCSLDKFERSDAPIRYTRVDSGPRACEYADLLADLPESLDLSDNEVVVGTWHRDVDFLYCWDGDPEVPLVTRRVVGDGHVYWVNSGDTDGDGPPRSLARPESGLVTLLATLVNHAKPTRKHR